MRGTSTSRIDLAAVLEGGRNLTIRETLAVPEIEGVAFPDGAAVALDVTALGRAAEIVGTIDTRGRGACTRCLEDGDLPLRITVAETLAPPTTDVDPLDDTNVLDGTNLDLDDLVRQLIASALPLAFTCSETCPGLCERCGSRRDACRCDAPPVETSWRI